MSVLEGAGVIYGSLHRMLPAVDGYVDFLLTQRRPVAAQELLFIRDLLTRDGGDMFQVCCMLLCVIVPEENIKTMLQDPMGPLWRSKKFNDKTRRFLEKEHDAFENIVFGVKKAIDSLTKQLQMKHPPRRKGRSTEFHVDWVSKTHMTSKFKEFLYRFKMEDCDETIKTIEKGISFPKELVSRASTNTASSEQPARGKVRNTLRRVSETISRVSTLEHHDSLQRIA